MLSPNLLKSQNSHVGWGRGRGGLRETNFQLLMLSPNLLKSQIPMSDGGGGGGWGVGVGGNQFPTFDAESKFAKIQNSHVWWDGGGGGGGGLVETNFQLLMLSPNLLKSQIPMSDGEGGGVVVTNFQKSTSNFLSPVLGEGGGREKGWDMEYMVFGAAFGVN